MQILYIDHYAGSPNYGMEYRPYYLAREWVRSGHKVTIVGASYSHVRQKQPKCAKKNAYETIDDIQYIWCKTPVYKGNGFPRAKNIFSFVAGLYSLIPKLQELHPDIVIASSTHPLDIFPAAKLAKKVCAKLVFEVHDLWPLTPVEVGGMSSKHPFIMLLQWAENYAYKNADSVISLLPGAKRHMLNHGLKSNKFHVVPSGIDLAEWESNHDKLPTSTHQSTFNKLKAQGKFIVGYAGSHGKANALDQLVDAAKIIGNSPFHFVFVGDGPEKNRLISKVQTFLLKNVTFLPSVSKSTVPALLAEMDALYLGWLNRPIYRFGINPNKLFDYMMAGKPIIHSCSASNDLVAKARAGISVEAENPHAIAKAIRTLATMTTEQRDKLGQLGKEYVFRNHDYRLLAQKFLADCV